MFFPLPFRMLNIMLPAYSRCYTSSHGAGLVSPADVTDYHEVKNLVLREKAVVWADQEAHQPEGVGPEEESQERDARGSGQHSGELAPMLSFSHLLYHTSSPCSKSSVLHLLPVVHLLLATYYLTRAQQMTCSNCPCLTDILKYELFLFFYKTALLQLTNYFI